MTPCLSEPSTTNVYVINGVTFGVTASKALCCLCESSHCGVALLWLNDINT